MYCSMENSPSKSISDQTWKCLNSFKALNPESYCSLMVLFYLGIFFIVGGWVRKVSRFFSSAMNLWSLLLCRPTALLVPATVPLSHEVKCKIALFAHVPLCRRMDKAHIHICNERFCVHKRSSANLSALVYLNSGLWEKSVYYLDCVSVFMPRSLNVCSKTFGHTANKCQSKYHMSANEHF